MEQVPKCHFANYLAELFARYLAYRQPPLPRIAKFSGATLMNSFLTRTSRLISKMLRISDKNTALESRTFSVPDSDYCLRQYRANFLCKQPSPLSQGL